MNDYRDPRNDSEEQDASGVFIRKLSGGLSVLVLLADMLLLIVLIGTLLEFEPLASAQPVPVQFLLIFVIYLFGILLFSYGRPAFGDMFDGLVYIFIAWPYILLAAGLLAVVALRFVTNFYLDLGFLYFLLYSFAVIVISSFGVLISRIVNEKIRYFAVPFLLVTLWQVYLWVWRVLSDKGVPTGWNLVGSLFLFAFVIIFIVILLREPRTPEDDLD